MSVDASADTGVKGEAPQPFDPLQFPLRGRGLIEASAGTGKTWTIALLYLRLVLGHGTNEDAGNELIGTAFPRPLAPSEILVMTFTDAATQELRERIRQRLTQAARVFAGEAPPTDDALERLQAAYPRAEWPARAAQLQLAAESMDDAAVHTLHAWAGRVLREHALASGTPFDEKIAPDDGPNAQQQALHDYWRRTFYPLDAAAARVVWQCFPGPQALWRAVHPLLRLTAEAPLHYRGEILTGEVDVLQELKRKGKIWSHIEDLENAARHLWHEDREQIEAIWRAVRPDLNGTSYRQKNDDAVFIGWLAALAAWSDGATAPGNVSLFSQSGAKLKKDKTLPSHAAFTAMDEWLAARDQIGDGLAALKARLVAQAARAVRAETAQIRVQRSELGFDDLLVRLDGALAGPGGDLLAARIRAQFPVALVDEFQDTDPVQYRILRRIYGGVPGDAASSALILIGDPKQAIYAFRGADIHTYLTARADALAVRGARASLDTNYRSTGDLVTAVNHLFERVAGRSQGAFGFKREDDDPVPFAPARAHGREEHLWIGGQLATALTLWNLLPEADQPCIGIADYRERMAQVFATQVTHWLSHTAQDDPERCGFVDAQGRWQPLQPRHIAVLVRSGTEATAIRRALQQRGVTSVYLSDRTSVFASQEARDVAMWLSALIDAADEDKLRAALATPTLDLSLSELERMAHDDLAWEETARCWRDLRECWQRQGVLSMLHALLNAHRLPARLLGQPGGERRLTNVLHLAEWLQTHAGQCDGPRALLRALQTRIREPAAGDTESLLRLESDGERLQVVTFHKSKGLEYPLVLLPFIAAWKDTARSAGPAVFHDPAVHAQVAELDGGYVHDRAQAERMAEDMRLLYVVLTRARHALWLGIAPLAARAHASQPQLENSALGQILGQGAPIDSLDAYRRTLADLRAEHEAVIVIEDAPAPTPQRWKPAAPPALYPARTFRHDGFAPWWIASYTALTRRLGAPSIGAAQTSDNFYAAAQEWALEAVAGDDAPSDVAVPSSGTAVYGHDVRYAFPRGADAGTVLHGLLQWCAQQGFARVLRDPASLRDQVARRLAVRGWAHWVDPLCDWLTGFLDTPLMLLNQEQPVCLSRLEQTVGEMEFWLPVRQLNVARFDELITAQVWPGQPRPLLKAGLLAGMIRGYIDLSFNHAGRYGVADYKFHWLGPDATAYGPDALRAVMLAHRYDVQAVLYLLALHRLLCVRLPGYDVDRHLGGAAYCFVRGSGAEGRGVITLHPPRALIEALDAALSESAA